MMLEVFLYTALGIAAILFAVAVRQLLRAFHLFIPTPRRSALGQEVDLPSVTVCIPARNEQHALTDCLQRVIASEYEKLEIIVLDDVSGDDTSALIKSFASEGVRFVKGAALPEGWVGKNHALQGLLQEASGSYVLFMDVDTRLAPMAIENMVRYALSQRASMVSVLPRREDGWRASVLFSPLRYLWELLFHRRFSPATASNAWLIRRSVLTERFGGFEPIKSAIQPETTLADALALSNEYRFLVGTEAFGVGYEKKWRSQLVTSVRLLYPLFGRKASLLALFVLGLATILLPYGVVATLTYMPLAPIHVVALVVCGAYSVLYGLYTHRVWKHGWLIGALLWPYLVAQECILLLVSWIQYARKTVRWKGRLIQPEARN